MHSEKYKYISKAYAIAMLTFINTIAYTVLGTELTGGWKAFFLLRASMKGIPLRKRQNMNDKICAGRLTGKRFCTVL